MRWGCDTTKRSCNTSCASFLQNRKWFIVITSVWFGNHEFPNRKSGPFWYTWPFRPEINMKMKKLGSKFLQIWGRVEWIWIFIPQSVWLNLSFVSHPVILRPWQSHTLLCPIRSCSRRFSGGTFVGRAGSSEPGCPGPMSPVEVGCVMIRGSTNTFVSPALIMPSDTRSPTVCTECSVKKNDFHFSGPIHPVSGIHRARYCHQVKSWSRSYWRIQEAPPERSPPPKRPDSFIFTWSTNFLQSCCAELWHPLWGRTPLHWEILDPPLKMLQSHHGLAASKAQYLRPKSSFTPSCNGTRIAMLILNSNVNVLYFPTN